MGRLVHWGITRDARSVDTWAQKWDEKREKNRADATIKEGKILVVYNKDLRQLRHINHPLHVPLFLCFQTKNSTSASVFVPHQSKICTLIHIIATIHTLQNRSIKSPPPILQFSIQTITEKPIKISLAKRIDARFALYTTGFNTPLDLTILREDRKGKYEKTFQRHETPGSQKPSLAKAGVSDQRKEATV